MLEIILFFIFGLILPFLVMGILFLLTKVLKQNIDVNILNIFFEITMRVTLSLWMIFMLKIFPLLAYCIFLSQVSFHKKYNSDVVGKKLEELNIKEIYIVINLLLIPVSCLMLYGIWFKTTF